MRTRPKPEQQPPADDQRIVVTGMGVVTPLGVGIAPFWAGLVAGLSATGLSTRCDLSDLPCQVVAEVPDFDPHSALEAKEARKLSRASQFAVAAARMAVADARLTIDHSNREAIGALIANSSTSPPEIEISTQAFFDRGPSRINPFHFAASLPHMPACQVAIQLGLLGYTTAIGTACAAGAQAIGEAGEIIRRGDADVMLAGGSEATICRLTIASFVSLRALTTRADLPADAASRPFDALRDGFVLGEGAGVLVLERLSDARRRNARIYAELIGYGTASDAYHITAPHPSGDGAARAMRRALYRAGLQAEQIDYVNAHATSTPAGDIAETLAIKQVFGEAAYRVPISAIKSMIGHLTSAAGAVEAAATILALQHGVIPPTINYASPDPACDLDYVPNKAREAALHIAMTNSFGFGGVNSALVFSRARGE
ncbi:MAG TPA: beta-ketoacyl-ACP synthase II [Kouleothrix sp.]|uniref:beta-ketoacyl-ACP synthase II n=1 Tax=Kouleothrix sp. TaxID=2779161 RepID=UPI002BBAA989|nr:beta-ketoacyl-ACP synthase II [Kouleothrix sp.]